MVAGIFEDKSKWKKGVVIYGYDGTDLVPLKINADGELIVNLEAATVNIGDVDVASSVLPTGAATAANQTSLIAKFPDQVGNKIPVVIAAEADIATMQDDIATIKADIATAQDDIALMKASESSIDGKLSGTGALKDNGPAWTSSWGVSGVPISADISASPTAVTDAPTAGQKICIDDIIVGASVAQILTFTCETTAAVILILRVPAGQSMQFTFRGKRKLATADKKLLCQSNTAGTTSVCIGYHSEV
jgi:hypothetical protein